MNLKTSKYRIIGYAWAFQILVLVSLYQLQSSELSLLWLSITEVKADSLLSPALTLHTKREQALGLILYSQTSSNAVQDVTSRYFVTCDTNDQIILLPNTGPHKR